ncbi:HsdM family class I SAM-dependent methyltransferase [Haloarcula argentinensis]|uniref:N-6 DNA methylase n=1 Tax=Haloarcula argentinensis TaxID=43776 RepID=A0A847UBP3_HALAR|nr:N-6 DNA methylase [Haloarcula argentinensis]NLV13213.1 N-6 DNA methylase [Haloarcula argentinensis]
MPTRQLPNLDVHLISEDVETVDGVCSTGITDEGLQIQLEDQVLQLFYPVDPHREPIESEGASRVLFATGRGYVELGDTGILQYKFLDSTDYSTLLKQIISGEAEHRELDVAEALDLLTEEGYLPAYTSKTLGELMVGWAVSGRDDTVLDVATGSGSLLQQASEHTDGSKLVGIEIQPLVAELARNRLNDVEVAEIINQDFFDWRVPGQQELSGASQDNEAFETFDAVVGDPPMGRLFHLDTEARERIQEWAPGRGKSASPAFVTKAVSHLKKGGKGAFLLPKSALKDGLLEKLTETCGIHRIVELPVGSLNDTHSVELVLLTLIKEDRPRDVRDTGIAKFNQVELPENARGLFEQPLDQILQNRYNPYNAEIVRASHEDLEGRNVMRILSNPSIYDIITSDGFTRFGDISGVQAGSGLSTGNNDFFYFSEEERERSGIDEQFFRPVIKNPSDEVRTITSEDIDLYLLDLEPYAKELESQGVETTEDNVIEELRKDGHSELAEYIEEEPGRYNRDSPKYEVDYRGVFENPDLVISKFFDNPRCYNVQVDDALFDTTIIGIQTENREIRHSLSRLLNTPLYKEFFQTYADSIDLDWYRLNITSLRDIPIIKGALNQDLFDRMDPFFPPDDDNDLVRLNQLLIESCERDDERQAIRRYLASRDDYAWSWLMTLPEFEEFQELLESNKEEAREFVVNRFDQELLDQARNTFENIEFFEERRALLNDLLMEFEEGHYRGFLAGIVLQFEGVLADLVEEAGGEIIEEDHETKFKMPGKGRSQTKNLGSLISHFFDGVFSTFLDETVRQRRNQIAHGDVIENSRELSIHFFISFYALCNASLNEYVRLAEQDQPAAA